MDLLDTERSSFRKFFDVGYQPERKGGSALGRGRNSTLSYPAYQLLAEQGSHLREMALLPSYLAFWQQNGINHVDNTVIGVDISG